MEFVKGSIILGRWNGAPIRIHWTVLLSGLIFGGSKFLPVYWMSFIVIILIHEAGHAFVIRRMGLRVDEIVVHGIGGYCRWVGDPGPVSRSVIAWGGVLAQFILFITSIILFSIVNASHGAITSQIYRAFVISNIWIIVFNLIPVAPFDGAEAWKIIGYIRDDVSLYLRQQKRKKQDDVLERQLQEIMNIECEKD